MKMLNTLLSHLTLRLLSGTKRPRKLTHRLAASSIALESRELLTGIDASPPQYYWSSAGKVSTSLVSDEVAVMISAASTKSATDLGKDFKASPFAGFTGQQAVGSTLVVLKREQLPANNLEAAALSAVGSKGGQGTSTAPVLIDSATGNRMIPTREIVVALRPGQTAPTLFTRANGYESFRPLRGTTDQFVVTVQGTPSQAWNKANQLHESGQFMFASPNMVIQQRVDQSSSAERPPENQATAPASVTPSGVGPFATTNDPLVSQQWHLNNTGQSGGVVDADADIFEAWNEQTGSANVIVAVFDDGFDLGHPDLIQNFLVNNSEIAGNGIDDDGNGWIDDRNGLDLSFTPTSPVTYDGDPTYEASYESHGTAVAGVIAARGNNGIGVSGVSQRSKLLPIKIADEDPVNGFFINFSASSVAEGVYYAAGRTANGTGSWRGADITNHSWGGPNQGPVLEAAFAWAAANGRNGLGQAQFVAAGNNGGGSISSPAAFAGAIAIGASNDFDFRSSYSQYGPELSVVAPSNGGAAGITTTDIRGSAGYVAGDYVTGFGGTSSATPLVAGVAALMLSKNSNISAAQIRSIIESTADKIGGVVYDGNGKNLQYGYGRVNAQNAVSATPSPTADVIVRDGGTNIPDNSGTVNFGNTSQAGVYFDKTFTVFNNGSVNLILQPATITGEGFTLLSNFSADQSVSPGSSTELRVRMTSTLAGQKSATLSFASNDPDENPFNFTLQGFVGPQSAADIDVRHEGLSLVDGENTIDFGSVAALFPTNRRTIELRNVGNRTLAIQPATFSSSGFRFVSNVPVRQSLAPGRSVSFTVELDATIPGSKSTTLTIPSSDPDEPAFRVFLSGNVTETIKSSISGRVFNDLNGNGVFNTNEVGIANRTVYLDLNNNGVRDTGVGTARTLSATGLPIAVGAATVTSSLTASGLVGRIADVNVSLDITHTWDEDLDIYLVAPNGFRIALTLDRGSNGDNFRNTVFDDQAITPISSGAPPFTGTFRPEEPLSALNGLANLNGVWSLEVNDDFVGADTGTLNSWSIALSLESGEPSLLTDSTGDFTFGDLAPGTYRVRQVVPADWRQTTPTATAPLTVTIGPGQNVVEQNFGTQLIPPAPPKSLIDDGDSGFSTTGQWVTATLGYGNDRRLAAAGNGNATATWSFSNLLSGRYRVFATWNNPAANRANDVPFTIRETASGSNLLTTRVNQRQAPVGSTSEGAVFQSLGTVTITGSSLWVQLQNTLTGLVTADAIRIERIS